MGPQDSPVNPMDDSARQLFEAAEEAGWQLEDKAAIVGRLRDLAKGLPAEDEFCVLLAWLGRCRLVHKLGQEQYPVEKAKTLQVPDLLSIFRVGEQEIPLLIEVKVSSRDKLELSRNYAARLREYARLVGLPVLIACKWRGIGDLWTLVSLEAFDVKPSGGLSLTFSKGMKETLMSVLAGDFGVKLYPQAGIHLRLVKVGSESDEKMRITDAFFTDGDGRPHSRVPDEVFNLMLVADLEEHTETEGEGFSYSAEASKDTPMIFAQNVLWLFSAAEPKATWRQILKSMEYAPSSADVLSVVSGAIETKFVHNIFRLEPNTVPKFLTGHHSDKRKLTRSE